MGEGESGAWGAFTFGTEDNEGREVENVDLEWDILASLESRWAYY